MHRLLTEHPAYKQAIDEVTRIRAAQTRHREATERAERDYRAAAAEYQRQAVEALREGREAPEPPTPPLVDVALVQQLAQDSIEAPAILRQAERDLAPAVLPQLEERALEIEESIRQAVDTMRGLAREASELRVTAEAQRAAAELPPLVDPGAVDVPALVDLVVHGHRLLEARPANWDDIGGWDMNAPRGSQAVVRFDRLAGRR